MKQPKEKKEKTGRRKTIDGKFHTCVMGLTTDPNYKKCYFCLHTERVK